MRVRIPGLSLAQEATFCFAPSGPVQACTGAFPVKVEVFLAAQTSAQQPVFREFRDKAGNVVRNLTVAGQGNTLVFTRTLDDLCSLNTQKQLSIKTNGSVSRTTFNADGTQTVASTGTNVLILFQTDTGGPSSKLYVGRLVYTIDATGVFTIKSFNGTATDICAALQ
jgi:hypothetical protein